MYQAISKCRVCGNSTLAPILNLGSQALTGTFPRDINQPLTSGPLEIVKCVEDGNANSCGLVQLRHSYDLGELYGAHYGYRSSLNRSMVDHLTSIVKYIEELVSIKSNDILVDIGSNDGTLLKAYGTSGCIKVGIDPAGEKFRKYYPPDIRLIADFFSVKAVQSTVGPAKAKVITSIAMFYDLEDPLSFVEQVSNLLADDGIWVFEQSYLPLMIKANAYDSICHEHLEFYALRQIQWMVSRTGLKILNVEMNSVNGGSVRVTAAKQTAPYAINIKNVEGMLAEEKRLKFDTLEPELAFKDRVWAHREKLQEFVHSNVRAGRRLLGYGASTKGNVVLQFCGFTSKDIPCIADVNEEKHGCFTPSTHIPIVSEEHARSLSPEMYLVFPWHFRDFLVQKEQAFLKAGGKMIMPLPQLEIITEP